MDKRYICYCGLYCGNCAVMAKIEPAAALLYSEMEKAGFAEIINYIPGGKEFWPFLERMSKNGLCLSCVEGSGNPGCEVRICAGEKGVEICALCENYPCEKFKEFFKNYPMLKDDNALLREKGFEAWSKLQDGRVKKGYSYTENK